MCTKCPRLQRTEHSPFFNRCKPMISMSRLVRNTKSSPTLKSFNDVTERCVERGKDAPATADKRSPVVPATKMWYGASRERRYNNWQDSVIVPLTCGSHRLQVGARDVSSWSRLISVFNGTPVLNEQHVCIYLRDSAPATACNIEYTTGDAGGGDTTSAMCSVFSCHCHPHQDARLLGFLAVLQKIEDLVYYYMLTVFSIRDYRIPASARRNFAVIAFFYSRYVCDVRKQSFRCHHYPSQILMKFVCQLTLTFISQIYRDVFEQEIAVYENELTYT